MLVKVRGVVIGSVVVEAIIGLRASSASALGFALKALSDFLLLTFFSFLFFLALLESLRATTCHDSLQNETALLWI